MRTMFVWRSASTLPTVIVSADEHPEQGLPTTSLADGKPT